MKMKFTCMLMSVILMAICANSAGAIENYPCQSNILTESAVSTNISEFKPVLYADTIIYRYRVNEEGVKQYRRWNDTNHCWVDEDWIDC